MARYQFRKLSFPTLPAQNSRVAPACSMLVSPYCTSMPTWCTEKAGSEFCILTAEASSLPSHFIFIAESIAMPVGGRSERCSCTTPHRSPRFANTSVIAPAISCGSPRGVKCGTR